jgi:hypothetical protein
MLEVPNDSIAELQPVLTEDRRQYDVERKYLSVLHVIADLPA